MSKIKIYLLMLLAAVLAYGTSLRYGFSQDDWFHITISQASSLREFVNFFNPAHVSWIFFRPLSTQLPYFLATSLLPLATAPIVMHIFMLLVHATNAYLVTRISRKYTSSVASLILGIFYAISSIHFLSLFYIGAIQQLLSTLFSLLAIYHLVYKPRPSHLILASLTLAALLSKELSLRLPLILLILSYFESKHIKQSIQATAGSLVVTFLYLVIRFVSMGPGAPEYLMVLNPASLLATLMWYSLFVLGFPELILQYGLSRGLINWGALIHDIGPWAYPIITFALALSTLIIFRIWHTIKDRRDWHWLTFLVMAFVSLIPVLFLPTHRYPHYLDLAILFVGIWLLRTVHKLTPSLLVFCLLIGLSNYLSIMISVRTHWTVKRAIEARRQTDSILRSGNCNAPGGVVFEGDPSEVREISYALGLANGPRVICHNQSLPVYYQGIDP